MSMPWDYTETEYKKQAAADPIWALERKILYGLEPGEKLERALLRQHLDKLNIPDERRAFLKLLIE